jgi:hydrogenase nickel incorporation protein HypA/HybF
MHEMSLMTDLMRKIERVAREHGGGRVVRLRVTLGALSHFSPAHFQEHFEHASRGTQAEGAALDINLSDDIHAATAQDVLLENVEVSQP